MVKVVNASEGVTGTAKWIDLRRFAGRIDIEMNDQGTPKVV
jgi:hypothetical protein